VHEVHSTGDVQGETTQTPASGVPIVNRVLWLHCL